MANAGSLYVSILARTGGFSKGMKQVNKQLTQFRNAFSVSTMAAGVGIAAMIKKEMDQISSTGKLAERLGASTEALAAFREVAQDAGVEFGVVSKGIEKLSVSAGNAALGNKAMTEAFAFLGISIKDINKMSPDSLMIRVAGGLDKIQNSSQRAAMAQKIFGKGGVALLGFMSGLREKTAEAASENIKLGLSYSKVDAQSVIDAKIAIANLSDVMTGLFTQLTVQLAPKIEEAATWLFGMGVAGDSMAMKVGRGIDNVSAGFNVARNMILEAAAAVSTLNNAILTSSPAAKLLDWATGGKLSGLNTALGEGFSAAVKSPFDNMPDMRDSGITKGGWTRSEKKIDTTNKILTEILKKTGTTPAVFN